MATQNTTKMTMMRAGYVHALALLLCSGATAFQPVKHLSLGSRERLCLFYQSDDGTSGGSDDTSATSTTLTHQERLDNFLAMPVFQEAEEIWSQEWHDSFVRNGLVDFVPPLSAQLNCLLVGDGMTPSSHRLPGQSNTDPLQALLNGIHRSDIESGNTQRTFVEKTDSCQQEIMVESPGEANNLSLLDNSNEHHARISAMLERLFEENSLARHGENFDCILDRGLMDELLTAARNQDGTAVDVGLLLLEATRHIREHGVYIMVTKQGLLSSEMKEYLVEVGKFLGVQWRFDLDGISDEEATVSVARKYFTGELPSVGSLAKVDPPRQHP